MKTVTYLIPFAIAIAVYANDSTEVSRLDQIVVTGTKTEHRLRDVPVETVVITKDDIAKSGAQNVAQLLKTVPGMNGSMHDDVFGTYTWNARVRGFSVNDGYALVLVDGQRVVGAGQSGGMGEYGIGYNQVPVNQIERIEVVKGSGSALYGSDAAAGVINIITKKSKKEFSAGGSVRYSWYTVNNIETVQKDGSIKIDTAEFKAPNDSLFRNSSQINLYIGQKPTERFGYRLDYAFESGEDANKKVIPSSRHALNAKIDADLNDNLKFNLTGGISTYTKEEVKNTATATNRKEKSYSASPTFTWLASDKQTFKFTGYGYRWDFVHGFKGSSNGLKIGNIDQYQGGVQHTFQIAENNTLSSGIEFNRQGVAFEIDNYDSKGLPTTHIHTYRDVDVFSVFVQDEWSILDNKLSFVPGARFDNHSEFGSQINPKLAIMGKPVKGTTLRGSVGRSFKSPTIRELYYDVPYLHGSYYVKSNDQLKAETGMGYSAGAEQYLWKEKISLGATWFMNDMDDKVIKSITGDSIGGIPVQTYVNAQETRVQGVETSARLTVGEFDLTAGYTFTKSENKDLEKELPFQPKHSGSVAPSFTIKAIGMTLGATALFTGEQFTDETNDPKKVIEGFTTVGVKLNQKITEKGAVFFDVDNLNDSDKGQKSAWRTGRTLSAGFRFDI